MKRIFRLLVLLSLGLYVLWFFFPYIDPLIYDEDRLELWSYSGFDALLEFPAWHFYLWLVFNAVITVGLYRFDAWSRDLLIICYILSYFLSPIYGTAVQSPISGVLGSLVTLLDGVVIGMAYFSPIASRFSGKAT